MAKNWKDLAEALKDLAEAILEEARKAFQEGDIEKGVMLTSEFRKTIKTAGDLNMIAQGMGELEETPEEEDIEKALGIEEEPEKVEEEPEEEEFEEELEEEEEPEEDIEEETEGGEENESNTGETLLSLEQILRDLLKKKI